MSFPERDHTIPLTEAAAMTRRHRLQHPKAEKGGLFDADQVRALLSQPGAMGLRYYHGVNEDGTYAIILVAVDAAGLDLTDEVLLERHIPCPPFCDTVSDLATSAWVARARAATMGSQRLIPA
jgi:hypothetical protein